MINYPLKFTPILKEKIWGGSKLKNILGKTSNSTSVGESWEISGVKNDISVVSNGVLKGKLLTAILSEYQEKLVGKKVYEKHQNEFPLLIKFLDANKPLSVQVHPDDDLARKRGRSFGKSEAWYLLETDANAQLTLGFSEPTDAPSFLNHLQKKTLSKILNTHLVNKNEAYYIPAGIVHSIGAGVLLAEVQETSDLTYRIYDWNRKDNQGNTRELHLDEALEAIDYKSVSTKIQYKKEQNNTSEIVSCPYFMMNLLPVNGKVILNHTTKDSFVIYMCTQGKATIHYNQTEQITMQTGETILLPACLKQIEMEASHAEFLEIYM